MKFSLMMIRNLKVFIHLAKYFCLRHLFAKPLRILLTVLGVSFGVSLFIAIDIVSDSILISFKESIESMSGKAQLTVFGSESGFPEKTLESIEKTEGVKSVVPMIESKVYFKPSHSNKIQTLVVLGIDLLKESSVRSYKTEQEDVIEDPLTFLNSPNSIIITRSFANENKLVVDSKIKLATSHGLREFVVRGILTPTGPAKAYGGKLAIMDIDGARVTFGKENKVDRADIIPQNQVSNEELALRIQKSLGPSYKVQSPETQSESMKNLVSGYSGILSFVSLLALFVSLFVVSNSMNIMVAEKRHEIGILRALGAKKTSIMSVTLCEALFIGTIGALGGIFLGKYISRLMVGAITTAMSDQYLIPVHSSSLEVSAQGFLKGLLAGIISSVFASLFAAYRSARVPPLEALKISPENSLVSKDRSTYLLRFAGFLMLFWIPIDFYTEFSRHYKAASYLAPVCAIFGCSLAGPFFVSLGIRFIRRISKNPILWLATDNLLRHPRRTGSNVMSLIIGLLMVILLASISSSAKFSAIDWISKVVVADLIVSSNGRISSFQVQPLNESMGPEINNIPGVDITDQIGATALRFVRQDYEGFQLAIKAYDPVHPRAIKNIFDIQDSKEVTEEFFTSQEPVIMVSENFVMKFKKTTGDVLTLMTPTGPVEFKIIAKVKEFANPHGVLCIPRKFYKKFWKDNLVTAFFVFAKPGVKPQDLADNIDRTLGQSKGIVATQHTELKQQLSDMIEDSFSYVHAIEFAALLIGLLGLLNTLIVSVLERTRELGMLRAIGMPKSQLVKMIFSEALLQGSLGAAAATLIGTFVSYYWVIGIISTIFGWVLNFKMPWTSVLTTMATGLIVGCLAGLAPARRVGNLQIREALEYE